MKRQRIGMCWDLLAAAAAVALVVVAIIVGHGIEAAEGTLHVNWPPLSAKWDPHYGPGTPLAIMVAVLVIGYGPVLAERLRWRLLLLCGWVASMAWIWSLALIDGWFKGIAEQLTTRNEYLQVIDRFGDIPLALRGFIDHILLDSPDNWPAHVAGHPPAATLTFVLLDRIGLGGGGWAGIWCITIGGTAVAAVLIALRALAGESLARKAAPFLVLVPAAVWIGTSADGYFAAVTAWTVAILAVAATGKSRWRMVAAAFGAGLLLGWIFYLSYGLILFAGMAAAVLIITRTLRPLPWLLLGTAVVPIIFTAFGFDWWQSYHVLVERYYQGAGGVRPYSYWVWANLACTVIITGLATVAGLRRSFVAVPGVLRRWFTRQLTATDRLVALVMACFLGVLAADLSGMSKAETERIWLPFAAFLLPATALLPVRGRRIWLAAQAVVALTVNHLLTTSW